MTNLDLLLLFLTASNIKFFQEFENGKTSIYTGEFYLNAEVKVETDSKFKGYRGFYTYYIFDETGTLTEHGAGE